MFMIYVPESSTLSVSIVMSPVVGSNVIKEARADPLVNNPV